MGELYMDLDIVYHSSEEIIREVTQEIRSRKLVFFVGSAISFQRPSKLPNVSEIKEYTIEALCAKDQKKYLDLIYSDIALQEKIDSIRHEEFLEILYRTIVGGEIAIRILNCLKKGEPNQNHFFLAEGLGQYFDVILTTNQDPLIERALEKRSLRLLKTTQQGDKIFENGRVIKLHGCVDKQESIITLLRQLARGLPKNRSKMLRNILENKCVLFTGYNGQDEDIFRILISTDWKRIYWNARPGSKLGENVEKLYQKYPDKFLLFEYDLNDLFAKLTSDLKFRRYEADKTSHPNLQQIFDEWAISLGSQKFNVLGRILSNDRLAKYEEALECFNTTLSTFSDKTEGDQRILAKTYQFIGDVYMNFKTLRNNNYENACKAYDKAAKYYSKFNVEGEANALVGIGESYRHRARYWEAVNSYKKALQKIIRIRDEDCISPKVRCHLADAYRMQDEYEEAIREYRQAHELFKKYGFIANAVYSWVWLGEVYVYKGDYGKASWYNSMARRISRKYHFENYFAWAKYVEAEINNYKGTGKMESLEENREEELDKVVGDLDGVFENLKNRLGQAWCNQMLAELYRLRSDYKEAEKKNEKALEFCGRDGVDYRVCLVYIGLDEGEILRAQGQYDAAIRKYEQVLNTKIGDLQRHHAHAVLGIAETNRMKGIGNQAEYEKALEMYKNIGMRHGIVHTLIGLSLFTGLRNKNPLSILKLAEDTSLKRPILQKELILIKKLKRECLKNLKDVSSWLHPLEFP
jgi:tetratricopeptide (TPR) repeat protein